MEHDQVKNQINRRSYLSQNCNVEFFPNIKNKLLFFSKLIFLREERSKFFNVRSFLNTDFKERRTLRGNPLNYYKSGRFPQNKINRIAKREHRETGYRREGGTEEEKEVPGPTSRRHVKVGSNFRDRATWSRDPMPAATRAKGATKRIQTHWIWARDLVWPRSFRDRGARKERRRASARDDLRKTEEKLCREPRSTDYFLFTLFRVLPWVIEKSHDSNTEILIRENFFFRISFIRFFKSRFKRNLNWLLRDKIIKLERWFIKYLPIIFTYFN